MSLAGAKFLTIPLGYLSSPVTAGCAVVGLSPLWGGLQGAM